tara:strand:- start:72 stop:362 length:291 start_codon:yes stop_codon:yes gene_type:complete
MSDNNNAPEEIDPIEIEVNLINELIEDNIVIIIHQNGMSIMMNDDVDNRSNEQMKLFSRLYVASKPSFVLRLFLILEVTLLLVWESMEDLYHRWMK